MGRTIAIANQKGGVGKTTTAINLSACLAEAGQRVLTIDFDPQGNATTGLGLEKEQIEDTVYELLLGDCTLEDCLMRDVQENLDVLPSDSNLAGEMCIRDRVSGQPGCQQEERELRPREARYRELPRETERDA